MNPEYAAYAAAHPLFYDATHHAQAGPPAQQGAEDYAAALGTVPPGWEEARRGDWRSLAPAGAHVPPQGWKIHVSASLEAAPRVLARTARLCFARRVPFKFVPTPTLLLLRNGKYADRAGSGKFLTLYPPSPEDFEPLCRDLAAALDGEPGPYILSDLRIGPGPVHVRYGAFAPRFCPGPDGLPVPAVADPEGTLVPDPRGPVFTVPAWVTPPPFLAPHLAARTAAGADGIPYDIEGALHFSNGGGVYRAKDPRTGRRLVLKEARPHAGLAADGTDAVTRLAHEEDMLRALAGLDCVPAVHEHLAVGEHRFLVMDFVPGTTLNTLFARRFPLSRSAPGEAALAEHAAWAERMHRLVTEAVAAVHGRGVVMGDLHMSNVMVSEDEQRVVLLDFEAASRAADAVRPTVANPAFAAPRDRTGQAVDTYALACLRLALHLPLTTLFGLDRGHATRLADAVAETFPVPRASLDTAVREIEGAPDPGDREPAPSPDAVSLTSWPRARDLLVRALLASRTPERGDRCFPGDIAQFASPAGGASLGHGTAGVLHALDAAGERCPEAEEWLLARTKAPASGTPCGLYDGLAGIAWTLDRLGHPQEALDLAALVAREPLHALPPTLHGGQAGIALVLGTLAARADSAQAAPLRAAAARCAEAVAHSVREAAAREKRPAGSRAGLLHGASGAALLLIRRYEETGDTAALDLAATALRLDLAHCRPGADDALLVVEGKRTMPYLGGGSAGLAMVLDDYLVHRPGDPLAAHRAPLRRAATSRFYIQPGLFRGVAGLVLHLARTPAGDPPERRRVIERHRALLTHQALPYADGLAFPGEQLLRLSMDLATGTAGCLLALGSAYAPEPARFTLPYLPPPRPTDGPRPGAGATTR
ncbi:class III lanthionine synthetase LanKC [Streptomyces sp. NPDC088923]|uniref:class III lanthionine synthetase LanKC n=1 Tax=Streptomyces sp. NPDC088923 TaxID=3365913 RepID=UPI003808554C